jgi:plastocyanin
VGHGKWFAVSPPCVGLVVMALLTQSCGGSQAVGSVASPSGSATAAASASPPPPNQVWTSDSFKFTPAQLEVRVGTTVTWREATKYTPHNVRLDADPENVAHDLENLDQTWSFQFKVPGTYPFVCTLHADQGMTGEVIVKP